jgi:hypothetical protein
LGHQLPLCFVGYLIQAIQQDDTVLIPQFLIKEVGRYLASCGVAYVGQMIAQGLPAPVELDRAEGDEERYSGSRLIQALSMQATRVGEGEVFEDGSLACTRPS